MEKMKSFGLTKVITHRFKAPSWKAANLYVDKIDLACGSNLSSNTATVAGLSHIGRIVSRHQLMVELECTDTLFCEDTGQQEILREYTYNG